MMSAREIFAARAMIRAIIVPEITSLEQLLMPDAYWPQMAQALECSTELDSGLQLHGTDPVVFGHRHVTEGLSCPSPSPLLER